MQSEFELIDFIRQKVSPSRVKTGIGDDCAVLPKDSKNDLVITTDLLVEDIDFRLKWTNPEFLGHKALAVSLSDIAAMGATPVWSMLSIGIPEKIWQTDFVEKFYRGYLKSAKKFGVELVGGDVSKTPDKIVVDSIAAGEAKKGKAVLRSGAKVGDLIFVTGKLGGAAIGLEILESGRNYDGEEFRKCVERQLKPNPQTQIGQILGAKNLTTAMIDLSDGLSGDLSHICRASKTGAKIFAEKVPLEVRDSKIEIAFDGGEDFELLFTVNPKKISRLEKELKNHKISLIGEMTANVEIIELIANKNSQILQVQSFRHF